MKARAGVRLLLRELAPYQRSLFAVAGLALLLSAPTATSGVLIARALDDGFFVRQVGTGLWWLALLVQIQLAGAVLTRVLFGPLARIVEPLRDRLVTAITAAGLDRALAGESAEAGAAVRQATDETESVRRLVATVLRNVHTTVSVAIGALAGLAAVVPVAALVLLPGLLAAAFVYRWLVRFAWKWQRKAILVEERLADDATKVFTARRDIVAFAAEPTATRQVREGIDASRHASVRYARVGVLRSLTVSLGVDLGLLALLSLAPVLISDGRLSSGDLVAAVYYVMFGLAPAVKFLVYGGAGWVMDLVGTMARLSEVATGPGAPASPRAVRSSRTISLRHVSYAYSPTADPVLDDVSLDIPSGQHLAVVGPSGAGKSTLASLLCGLRTPTAGSIRGGRSVALVPQEAYVFAGTVRENLAYLAPDTADKDLLRTARLFGLDELELDRELPPGGAGLSAGERQLITLARTHLSPAPVVILDEATCHLDPAAEQRAETAFARRGGTLVVIAHRISSAWRADRVLLVDGGRVADGTHSSLLAGNSRYRELATSWEAEPLHKGRTA
ncbi:ABC transporter ATP-binding protein [Amycolatopsis oliviviridis]|uniref:ABC transporter ATP-binding protein n=1 Tax=Amycolatopsis oliviviridis TaxID=1471590 RepID=A0ABQ3L5D5_9PSEU|nr:ABC transporter ATP-binding protein [Amycolatopsis oliviviridis]GHH04808.1 ABC transporter ATP-binding protein [Amycolatopsis oliviviridis]